MDSIKQRMEKWEKFADLNSDISKLCVVHCAEGMPEQPMLWWENIEHRIEWSYGCYEKYIEQTEWLMDDKVPYLTAITGTEIIAEAFGCRVHYPSDMNPFALPLVKNSIEASRLALPKLCDTKLTLAFEMADKLKSRAGADALLSLPDIQSPLDVAALIWDKTDFFAAMLEEPNAVKELMHKITEFMFEFLDEWFKRYGKAFMAHYPDFYMPYGISMSIDEIGVISRELFNVFEAPALNAFRKRYGALGLHCCADSVHQWENIKKIEGIQILNLVRGEAETLQSLKAFQDCCGLFLNTYVSHPGEADKDKLHVAFIRYAETKDEALRMLEQFNRDWR